MIQREWQTVTESKYGNTADDYGQFGEDTTSSRTIEMVIHQYDAKNVSNPNYVDIVLQGLTDDYSVNTNSIITISGKKYGVKYTIPTKTYLQVFLYEL